MERSRAFEAALVIAIIGLTGLLLFMVTAPKAQPAGSWEIAGNGSVDYMFVGGDDMLYAFSGNNIAAMRPDGSIAWNLSVPSQWNVLHGWSVPIYSALTHGSAWAFSGTPIVAERSGMLYVYLTNSSMQPDPAAKLIAIGSHGDIAWEHEVSTYSYPGIADIEGLVSVKAYGDREYLFHDYSEDVLDRNGRLLFTLHNLSAPVSVDASGHIYAVRTSGKSVGEIVDMANDSALIGMSLFYSPWSSLNDSDIYLLPSGIVDAYGPDGSLLWSRDIGERTVRQPLARSTWQDNNMLPLYSGGTLYVPVTNGVAALDTAGNVLWIRHIPNGTYMLFGQMPVDSSGNVYLRNIDTSVGGMYAVDLYVIAPNGSVAPEPWHYVEWDSSGGYKQAAYLMPASCKDGVAYGIQPYEPITFLTFNESMRTLRYGPDTVLAVDIMTNRTLWNFTIPDGDRHALTLNGSNVNMAFGWGSAPAEMNYETKMYLTDPVWARQYALFNPAAYDHIQIYPGNGVTYINYDFMMYEYPVVYNISRCIYARSIYAIDDGGKLLWAKSFNGTVSKAAAGNSTIYYLTNDGRIGGNTAGIAAGIALVALAYMFLRFFTVGAVTRAKNRLEQNENRSRVLRYVSEHPGATTADIVKGLGMNTGTIRYHLFILTLNHKIITHNEDDKYLRYFRNSGAYTEEERSLLSLMRREPLRRTLFVLSEKPGLTGPELAKELNVSATAANRHIALLAGKGVIVRSPMADRGHVYTISDEYRDCLSKLSDML